jgi:two-component system, LuxR family, response regulator FixJ
MPLEHVYLVEDNAEIRFHLKALLINRGYKVHEFEGAQAFLDEHVQLERPCVLVLDMRMPKLSGLDLQNHLKNQNIFIPIIFISGESHQQEIISAMKGGAIEFLWKPFKSDDLLQAIQRGINLDTANTNLIQRKSKLYALQSTLTPQENKIFLLMLGSLGNIEIGAELGIFSDTVKKHRAQVMAKMQVTKRSDLVTLWQGIEPKT